MVITKTVYNLEFPSWCQEMTIFGYRFSRVADYAECLAQLQHPQAFQAEFRIDANTGQHTITAVVDIPSDQHRAVIGWPRRDEPALSDILLLISLFSGRDVFTASETDTVVEHDPRVYEWGGVLRSALSHNARYRRPRYGHDGESATDFDNEFSSGFATSLNHIYAQIRRAGWLANFRRGYYLVLAQRAFRRQPIESVFVQCWTIWEHLFDALYETRFAAGQKQRVLPHEKVITLLEEFTLKGQIDPHTERRMKTLASIRHDLFYAGRFPLVPSRVYDEVVLFIRLTEFVIAKTLGL